MVLLDVVTGAVSIADAFSLGENFLPLRITYALFLSCFSTQHSISATLYFPPVSKHNTVYLEFCVVLNRQLLEVLLLFVCCGVHIL